MVCNPAITALIKLWFVGPASAGGRETAAINLHPALPLQLVSVSLCRSTKKTHHLPSMQNMRKKYRFNSWLYLQLTCHQKIGWRPIDLWKLTNTWVDLELLFSSLTLLVKIIRIHTLNVSCTLFWQNGPVWCFRVENMISVLFRWVIFAFQRVSLGISLWFPYKGAALVERSLCTGVNRLFDFASEGMNTFKHGTDSPTGFPRRPSSLWWTTDICFSSCPLSSICVSYLVFHSFPDEISEYADKDHVIYFKYCRQVNELWLPALVPTDL